MENLTQFGERPTMIDGANSAFVGGPCHVSAGSFRPESGVRGYVQGFGLKTLGASYIALLAPGAAAGGV